MNRNMVILFLACLSKNKSGNIYGGAEKSIINLANWYAENNDDAVILASVEGKEKAYSISEKIIYEGFEVKYNNKLKTHLEIYRNTKLVMDKYRPDIIISFWIHPLFYGIVSGRLKNKFIFYSERNDPKLEYGLVSKSMRHFILKRCDGIVFQTHGAQQYFRSRIINKSCVIHNPVYIKRDEYKPYLDNRNRIVAVGRLNEQKNHKLLINAFSKITKKYPKMILEIYGEGPLHKELTDQIKSK